MRIFSKVDPIKVVTLLVVISGGVLLVYTGDKIIGFFSWFQEPIEDAEKESSAVLPALGGAATNLLGEATEVFDSVGNTVSHTANWATKTTDKIGKITNTFASIGEEAASVINDTAEVSRALKDNTINFVNHPVTYMTDYIPKVWKETMEAPTPDWALSKEALAKKQIQKETERKARLENYIQEAMNHDDDYFGSQLKQARMK